MIDSIKAFIDRWSFQLTARYIAIVAAAAILLSVFVICIYLWPNSRSITIDAATHSISIQFTALRTSWPLKTHVVCRRNKGSARQDREPAKDTSSVDLQEESPCGNGPYTRDALPDSEIAWSAGSQVQITRGGKDEPIIIRYLGMAEENATPPANDLSENSFILIPGEAVNDLGIYRFGGFATIGDIPTSGSITHMIKGHYEIWDIPRLRRAPMLTRTGRLLQGDRASIVKNANCENNCDVPGEGIVSFIAGEHGMNVVLHAGKQDDRLRVVRFGGTVAYLASSWFDRAKNDGLVIALSSMLAAVAALAACGSGITGFWRFFRGYMDDQL